jgi:phosphatidylinositol glycan class A protein
VVCTVTIVVISRLAYRKGVDLLVATAPRICAAFPNVRFVVGVYFVLSCDFSHYGIFSSLLASGGDGPKMVDLLQMRETHFLQDRITLLGPVPHRDVPSVRAYYYIDLILKFKLATPQVLQQGSIFLNTSLTEAFGIAILEAACAGLYVVSTRVGGVPEILPEDMISFASPTADGALFRPLSKRS